MRKQKLYQLVQDNKSLFWSIGNIYSLNTEAIVETILNYGRKDDIQRLFEILGKQNVKKIFYHQIALPRSNYLPETKNFFQLYFRRHA